MKARASKYNILLASSVVVITATVICILFYQSYNEKYNNYMSLNNQLKSESRRFTRLDDMSSLVALYEEKFNQYMPVKQYEDENRLYFLDSLERIRLQHKVPALSYSISARKPYDYKDGIIKEKGLKVSVSDIELKMSLMHEGDLLDVVASIKQIKKSVHIVTACQLSRIGSAAVRDRSSGPNIDALCNIKWFTFKVS
ncbi:MAG: hypothetical protein OEY29_08470 [Gammaproteobacteria bacterium]|nr:hypothetical protein [Gammaproteobacteria bacterium]